MTLIVGILCSDGVVLASDSAATYGTGYQYTIGQLPVTKLHPIKGQIIFGATGAVGAAQLIQDKIEALWDEKALGGNNATPYGVMHVIGDAIAGKLHKYIAVASTMAPLIGNSAAAGPVTCRCLVGMHVKNEPRLFEFYESGIPESYEDLRFVAVGSGQTIADPFLALLARVLKWKEKPPTVSEGRFAAIWTVKHTIQTNAGGVGGDIQVLSLLREGSKFRVDTLAQGNMDEHKLKIEAAEKALYDAFLGESTTTTAMPTPPTEGKP